ncbi:mechanosensitive ion channel protein [Chloropicon primus]|uniref:Mechanosensitive ion channel protein n=2 Tax=Chloropicon primus TaxID=1764295 RepID=A0A5B8MWB9_9CHLO|nr:mechanosensitive ion channel protein [Chloropicon primus]UPR04073.1 mechanosensitive ion channel protein [Chloropicon primus]|eukprot:QDZ24863.1 mechanosensitive ion channel protein [Chloropicon primus]
MRAPRVKLRQVGTQREGRCAAARGKDGARRRVTNGKRLLPVRAKGEGENASNSPKESAEPSAKRKKEAEGQGGEDKLGVFEAYYSGESMDFEMDNIGLSKPTAAAGGSYAADELSGENFMTSSMDEEKLEAFESYYTQLEEEKTEREAQERRQEQYFASASEGSRNVDLFFQVGLVATIAWVSGYLAVSSGSPVPPPRLLELFALILLLGFEAEKVIVKSLPKSVKQYATLLEFVVQLIGWTYVLLSAAKGPLLYEIVPVSAATAGDTFLSVLPSLFVTLYAAKALNSWKRRALRRAAKDQMDRAKELEQLGKDRPLMSTAATANAYVVADRVLTPIIWIANFIFSLDQLGVPLKPLLTFGGVAGLAVGFAAQQVVSNLFGGLVLNTTTPFNRNDLIADSKGNFEGFVDKVGWFITRLQCPAGPVFIPNSVFLTSVVTNKTSVYGKRRSGQLLAVTVSIRHADIYLIEKVLKEVRKAIARIDTGPDGGFIDEYRPVRVYVCAIGAHSIDIGISCGLTSGSTEDFLAARSKMFIVICKAVLSTGAQLAPRYEEHEDRKTLAYPRYEDLWRWAGGSTPEVPYPSDQGTGAYQDMLGALNDDMGP